MWLNFLCRNFERRSSLPSPREAAQPAGGSAFTAHHAESRPPRIFLIGCCLNCAGIIDRGFFRADVAFGLAQLIEILRRSRDTARFRSCRETRPASYARGSRLTIGRYTVSYQCGHRFVFAHIALAVRAPCNSDAS